jgi:hypothetical protein
MKKKHMKRLSVMVGLSLLLAVGMAVAGTQFVDVITMENKQAYDEHKQGIVSFTHKKHTEEYKIGCGDCHHDKDGKPLTLKAGDDVKPCLDCHVKGKADKKALASLPAAERKKAELKFHYDAIHENCQGCHEKFNIEKAGDKNKGPAPVACVKCHPKKAGAKE